MESSNKCEYGAILTRIIKERKITQQDFYNRLGIKKPYFYDIISGKINPPPAETQLKIFKILNPDEKDKRKLLELAADSRNEMPADVFLFLRKNNKLINSIRNQKEYKKFMGGMIDE